MWGFTHKMDPILLFLNPSSIQLHKMETTVLSLTLSLNHAAGPPSFTS